MISMDARIEIRRVENGYTIIISNDGCVSHVFPKLQEALNFIREYMEKMLIK